VPKKRGGLPSLHDSSPARRWRIGYALAACFAAAVIGLALLWWVALVLLHHPTLQSNTIGVKDYVGVAQLVFASVAGAGALVALVVAYRRQRVAEDAATHDLTRVFNERFTASATQLGDSEPAVRLAGVHAMAGLADDWVENRQTCVDVLCARLRLPTDLDPGEGGTPENRAAFRADREVRHTIIRLIGTHLRPGAAASWEGLNLDFTGVTFDAGDFTDARFPGGIVRFDGAEFPSGRVSFDRAKFSGAQVSFDGAKFSGGRVDFGDTEFSGGRVSFERAEFSGGLVVFTAPTAKVTGVYLGGTGDYLGAKFSGGEVSFMEAGFSGAEVRFDFAEFSGRMVKFFGAKFSDGLVLFTRAKFSGAPVDFRTAEFSGAKVSFEFATFSGGNPNFAMAKFSGGLVSFGYATFSGGRVVFLAEFSGAEVRFVGATFSGGEIRFDGVGFSGGKVDFRNAKFSGADVRFNRVEFSGAKVSFESAEFSSAEVNFEEATFTGSEVDFRYSDRSSHPPAFDWESTPAGVTLPDPDAEPASGYDY
jgi:uncharacterized protein YjbI with pentapeptide repeats